MIEDKTYSVERYTAEIDAKVYIEGFRRADYFIKFCQQYGNYGCRYGCPPFEEEPLAAIEGLGVIGFDISKTSKDLLGLDIKWSQDGLIPEYLTLVCGIFYKKH